MWAPLWRAADARGEPARCARATTSGSSTRPPAGARVGTGERAMNGTSRKEQTIMRPRSTRPRRRYVLAATACCRWRRPRRCTARTAAPPPRPAPAATRRCPGRRPTAKPSLEIYGFAMLDIGHDFKQINPNWFDTHARRPSCRRSRTQFGEDGNTFAGVRQSRLGVKSSTPTDARRAQDDLRVRAVRHRRRRGPDHVPAAPRLRRARALRRRPDLEPVHGPGRLPELARVLGPDRHGVLPQRPVPLDADRSGDGTS